MPAGNLKFDLIGIGIESKRLCSESESVSLCTETLRVSESHFVEQNLPGTSNQYQYRTMLVPGSSVCQAGQCFVSKLTNADQPI